MICATPRQSSTLSREEYNSPMESFFASLKKELIRGEIFATRAEARASIFEYIEVFYNRIRRHSSLGYKSPAEYEKAS
jgi:putative transposase